MEAKISSLKKNQVKKIFSRFFEINPSPKGELNYTNNFTLLVAVVLSAQATDKSVNEATKDLFKIVNNPQDILKIGELRLRNYIKRIGLYKTKAKNIIKLSDDIIKKYKSKVPDSREELLTLAGVGRKTANVVLNIAFHKPTMAVDTHVFRVSNRTGIALGKSVLEVEKNLVENIPKKYMVKAHHWLILHGRYVCKARNPECLSCKINDLCLYTNDES